MRTAMSTQITIAAALIAVAWTVSADEPRRWNQDEAVARVKKVIEIENKRNLPSHRPRRPLPPAAVGLFH